MNYRRSGQVIGTVFVLSLSLFFLVAQLYKIKSEEGGIRVIVSESIKGYRENVIRQSGTNVTVSHLGLLSKVI